MNMRGRQAAGKALLACIGTVCLSLPARAQQPSGAGSDAAAPARRLPAVLVWGRTLEEFRAGEARLAAQWGEDQLAAFRREADAFSARYGREPRIDGRLARSLIDELYRDLGEPALNYQWQWFVIMSIRDYALRQNAMTDEGRRRLASGLLEYYERGGGQANIPMQARLAAALLAVAEPGDAAEQVAELLLADALVWAWDVEDPEGEPPFRGFTLWMSIAEKVRRLRGEEFVQQVMLEAGLGTGRQDFPAWHASLLRRLTDLLGADPQAAHFARDLDRLSAEILLFRRPPDAHEDIVARLLLAYRLLLTRGGAALPDAVVEVIDRHLARMVAQNRLPTDRHRDLWCRAVSALGPERASAALRDELGKLTAAGRLTTRQQAWLHALLPARPTGAAPDGP